MPRPRWRDCSRCLQGTQSRGLPAFCAMKELDPHWTILWELIRKAKSRLPPPHPASPPDLLSYNLPFNKIPGDLCAP